MGVKEPRVNNDELLRLGNSVSYCGVLTVNATV